MDRGRISRRGVMLAAALAASAALTPMAQAGDTLRVSRSVDFKKTPAEVWAVIGEFSKLHTWHPAVESVAMNGDGGTGLHRVLTLVGGGEIDETLTDYSLTDRSYSYVINSSPLPVANYTATIAVKDAAGSARVVWESSFEADGATPSKAKEIIGGIYEAGFENLAKILRQ